VSFSALLNHGCADSRGCKTFDLGRKGENMEGQISGASGCILFLFMVYQFSLFLSLQ
jgi:hypothetical protein